ncbi:hypothetical protein [Serinicoccus marinus]|uniref:hypothetical protein n=1 Tax=Serinicoccus marinus TaxID=247333 RepID=UPI001EE7D9BF|nr:hypothetical protein [Serinicoccus marinus]
MAPWLTNKSDELGVLSEIVAKLKDSDPRFRYARDWFRLLLCTRPDEDFTEPSAPDTWDSAPRAAGYRAMDGTTVKSEGERWVANFLYLHGVSYEYERPYTYDTADAEHRQYHPDFYYPDIDVWHEHWGLDADGNPRPGWTDYLDGMERKRQLHRQHGTTLVETTWAEVMHGDGLSRLEKELVGHGIRLHWDPDRAPVRGVKVVTDADLLRLVRTFMLHVKANSLDRQEVRRRLGTASCATGDAPASSWTSTGRSTTPGRPGSPTAATWTSRTCSCRPPTTSSRAGTSAPTDWSWSTSCRTPARRGRA